MYANNDTTFCERQNSEVLNRVAYSIPDHPSEHAQTQVGRRAPG